MGQGWQLCKKLVGVTPILLQSLVVVTLAVGGLGIFWMGKMEKPTKIRLFKYKKGNLMPTREMDTGHGTAKEELGAVMFAGEGDEERYLGSRGQWDFAVCLLKSFCI